MGLKFQTFKIVSLFVCLTATSFAATETFYENSSSSPALGLIQSARQSIDIEIYTMNDPAVHAALKDALARGVRLRIIQDGSPVGAACRVFNPAVANDSESCAAQKLLVTHIRSKGGIYEPFMKQELCARPGSQCYQHGKMVIIDSKTVMVSTGNFDTSNLCDRAAGATTCNRDYTMVSTDANVVRTIQTIFDKDLNGKRYDVNTVLAASGTRKLTVSPYSLQPLVDFIRSAKKSVQIQNQYLNEPQLNAALIEVAMRGVKVFVNVTSFCAFGRPSESAVAKFTQIYGAFDNAKINTRMFTRKIEINGVSGYMHAKAILVDAERAWVGSVNGSATSLTNNREYGLFFDDPAEIRKLSLFMYNDYMNLDGETWQESLVCKNDRFSSSLSFLESGNDRPF